jgi:hypothetical protein
MFRLFRWPDAPSQEDHSFADTRVGGITSDVEKEISWRGIWETTEPLSKHILKGQTQARYSRCRLEQVVALFHLTPDELIDLLLYTSNSCLS